MRDGAAELLEVILDKWWTWFGQPTAQRIKTSCSDDVPLTSIFCSPVPLFVQPITVVFSTQVRTLVSEYLGFSCGGLACANNRAVSSRGSTASTCHSGVLITLPLRLKMHSWSSLCSNVPSTLKGRGSSELFLSRELMKKPVRNAPRRTPVKNLSRVDGSQRSGIRKKGGWTRSVEGSCKAHTSLATTSIEYLR